MVNYVSDSLPKQRDDVLSKSNWKNLMEKYNLAFKRPERLDVKKPGPPISTGNYKGKLIHYKY